ncbi:hypothetical protein [Acetobacter persici]|nr:hypothetical protein [Acetobacter persici]
MIIDLTTAYGVARRYSQRVSESYRDCRSRIFYSSQSAFLESCNLSKGTTRKLPVGMMNARISKLFMSLPDDPSIERKAAFRKSGMSSTNFSGLSTCGFLRREIFHMDSPEVYKRSTPLVMAADLFRHTGGNASYRSMNSHIVIDQYSLARWFSRRRNDVKDIDFCQAVHHAAPLLYALQSVAFNDPLRGPDGEIISRHGEAQPEETCKRMIRPCDFIIPVPGGVLAGGSEIVATTEIGGELEWDIRPKRDVNASMSISPREPSVLAPAMRIRTFLSEDMLPDHLVELCHKIIPWMHGIDDEKTNQIRSGDTTVEVGGYSIADLYNEMNSELKIWRRRLLQKGHYSINFLETQANWQRYVAKKEVTDEKRISRLIGIPEGDVKLPELFRHGKGASTTDTPALSYSYAPLDDIRHINDVPAADEMASEAYNDPINAQPDEEVLTSGIIAPVMA